MDLKMTRPFSLESNVMKEDIDRGIHEIKIQGCYQEEKDNQKKFDREMVLLLSKEGGKTFDFDKKLFNKVF